MLSENSNHQQQTQISSESVNGDLDSSTSASTSSRTKLEEIIWDHSFVRELPGDKREGGPVRQQLIGVELAGRTLAICGRATATKKVPHACYTKVSPSVKVDNPQLVSWSESCAELLDLDPQEFESTDFPLLFSGAVPLKGSLPYAQCYGGHQFGFWAGQLGDGRAITLGELINKRKERWELQLKGAGRTPYSRSADGLAVLRSSIREFLCSEAMHFLGIPTTRALCLVTTGNGVIRDMFYDGNPKEEPGAVVCRVAQSFLRIGSFQIHAARTKEDLQIVRTLTDYVIRHHFPHLIDLPAPGQADSNVSESGDSGGTSKVTPEDNKFLGKIKEDEGQGKIVSKAQHALLWVFSSSDKINDVAYRLKLTESRKIHSAFHTSLLRLYVGDAPEDMPAEEQPKVEELDEVVVPEQVLAHKERKVKGKVARRYLMKFRNYLPMDAKWMEEGELAASVNA
ncbi:hypothetical protein L7F22_059746 [Adiantum nelumboides]|nr:hypothetical protein [Adiantum nelumboides]